MSLLDNTAYSLCDWNREL